MNPAGELETGLSPCAEITPTGICNAEPSLAGVPAVSNSHQEECGLDVGWGPLDPATRYLGAISHNTPNGLYGLTLLRVDSP